jgi:hypothetical protein
MKPKPYIIRGNNHSEESGIIKISYGKKYVIAKCKTQARYLKTMENDLNAFIRGGKNSETGTYHFLYNYVKAHPGQPFIVETLLETNSGYELLKREQQELDAGRNNPHFLNNQVAALIPQYDEATGMYGWISVNAVRNFQRWLKNYRIRPKKSSV